MAVPPPRRLLVRLVPARALPVPFWRNSFLVLPATQFNAYTVLRQKRLVLTRAALEELRKTSK